MSQDSEIYSQTIINSGSFSSDNGAVKTTGSGSLTATGTIVGGATVVGAIASNATINTNVAKASVAPAAAVTGIILQKGTVDGQGFDLVNLGTSTSTVTFATAATSNVQGGTGTSVAVTAVAHFVWDAGSSLWYLA